MATKITTPELFNLSSNNTAATQLPVFTTSTRPTPLTSTVTVDYLVVAGGGGTYAGGGANYIGGGGAGGLRTSYGSTSGGGAVAEPSISLSTAKSYAITVGPASLDGEDSVFGSITSLGGGRSGATASTAAGSSGGSGGGASGDAYNAAGGSGTANQGYSGGNSGPSCSGGSCRYPGGGGGGAASAGANATTTTAGNGGNGLEVNIIGGTGNYYAGGGGGSSYLSGAGTGGLGGGGNGSARLSGSEVVNNGATNTGGGGGGGLIALSTPALGGSGIVILRYPTSSSLNITTTGSLVYTESTDGSDTVLQFTEGSGNFGFAANNIAVGEMIFNSTTGKVEYWDGFQWNMIKDEQTPAPADPTGNGGLWAWYPLISNSNDNSGNGRNATNSGVSFTSDGGRFTGGNSISPPSGFIDFGYTHVCWVKPNHTAAGYTFSLTGYQGGYYGFTTFGFYKDTASTGFYTWQRGTNTVYWYTSNAGLSSLNSGYNLLIAQFVSGQSVKFSINGQALQTASGSGSGNPGGPYQAIRAVGKGWINGSAAVTSLDSYYRNYRIYNRTLTNTEITDIYSAGSL